MFSHIGRLPRNTPASQALHLYIEAFSGSAVNEWVINKDKKPVLSQEKPRDPTVSLNK